MSDWSATSPELIGGTEALQTLVVHPKEEREDGIEGVVIVRIVVETAGSVCAAEIARPVLGSTVLRWRRS